MSLFFHSVTLISRRLTLSALLALFTIFLLSGCKPADETVKVSPPAATSKNSELWPRIVRTAKGDIQISHPPRRIVSTSITMTGTLLAINAPLVGTGATVPNTTVADDQGFFTQWSKEAKARNLMPMYQTEPNAEAVASMAPDMIIISATGGDSALKLYEQLSAIAPTLVINYDDKSWQELAQVLGQATGHEADAERVITDFSQQMEQVKSSITLPPQPVSAFVYQPGGQTANMWTENSAQGKLLQELGFRLAEIPEDVRGNTSMGYRKDIVQLGGERLAEGLNGNTFLLFSGDHLAIEALKANQFLVHLTPLQQDRVYPMGNDTFRLDYYSASNMLQRIKTLFNKD
ncbi:Fe2+-enterobactin ABC transporter substrate-binding protein [Yersinia ruckeri]|uniref:Fe2+-enterobactin ABC transporter substrate-binding protein n=1 Tax=Yersinia ruckeri TaxID=29486 RepID=UPI002263CDD9|nr:Fe2+-enterobactin ABC transporter substrate-binding protein [Yersinia ruckeri]UZX95328.1 Fe2+-enterobactin ABC transporter substrate-binding protein [Yersinia ruckeri]